MEQNEEKNGGESRRYEMIWKILRPLAVFLAAAVVVVGLCSMAWQKISDEWIAPVDGENPALVEFTVSSGSSLSRVARELEEAGLIRNHTFFKYYCDFAGLAQKIQSGDYLISPSMDSLEIAELLTSGDGQPVTANITIIPGTTVETVAANLREQGIFDAQEEKEFLEICRTGNGVEDYYFIADELTLSSAQYRNYLLEGYLAPNTYEIYLTATPLEIIRKLLSQTDKVFTADWQTRAEEMGMTLDETLILASMIEKEAKKSDFTRVSAVFHNRLASGMKLQSDPTVHYVTGVRRMSLTQEELDTNSPYNTYVVKGLPCGPICNPSPEAIYAALYPDESYVSEKYLYFCSKDPSSGELYFSRTLEEHQRAVEIYAPLWEQYDRERGL